MRQRPSRISGFNESRMLVGSYDYRLVGVSKLVAVVASYAALDLAAQITATRGRTQLGWLVGGAITTGL